jgi:hypothetical protein
MIVETMMRPREITADQRRRAFYFVSCGASIRQAAALTGASIADVTAWRDAAAVQRKAPLTGDIAASPELHTATRRGRKRPRKPVSFDGVGSAGWRCGSEARGLQPSSGGTPSIKNRVAPTPPSDVP